MQTVATWLECRFVTTAAAAQCDGTNSKQDSGVVGGCSDLVLDYIKGRAFKEVRLEDLLQLIQDLLERLRKAEERTEEVTRSYQALKKHAELLTAHIRELQMGLRRHVSERLSAEQLLLALNPSPAPPAPSPPVAPPPKPPCKAKPNRDRHGRRIITGIPKLVVEFLPIEVQLEGLENFERLDAEDTSILVHRRGGLVEVVIRRPKFVRRKTGQEVMATAEVANGHALAELDAMLEQADVVGTVEVADMEGRDEAADGIAVTETTVVCEVAEAAGIAVEAVVPVASEVAGISEAAGVAEAIPEAAGVAEAVGVPEVTEAAGVAEAVEVPEVAEAAGVAEAVRVPEVAEAARVAEAVRVLEIAATPGVAATEAAGVAEAVQVSEETDIPEVVGAAVAVVPDSAVVLDVSNVTEAVVEIAKPAAASRGSVVYAHQAFVAPEVTGFKFNPFVQGAIILYTPTKEASKPTASPPVLIAPPFERPILRGMADASLIAHLLVQKCNFHTPYFRQEKEFDRQGFHLSRTNMACWQFEVGELLVRIRDAMWKDALRRSWIAMDGTGTTIRAEDKCRHAHVFVLVAPGDSVLFRCSPKYNSKVMIELFGACTGTFLVDASANHNILFGPGKGREGGCWAHARRPFAAAFRAGEEAAVAPALQWIQKLFLIERDLTLRSPEERLRIRKEQSAPLVDEFFQWVDQQIEVAPQESLLRKGLVYARNQREALHEFLRNGEIPISNNISERELRAIVKGRINWLFHSSDEHADRACAVFSLIASCEMHGLDPELYLQEILTVGPNYPVRDILDLSPKNWIATRQRLIAEGSLRYLDLAKFTEAELRSR